MNLIFDKIEERDIDFIVMRAFMEIPVFSSLFLDKIDYQSGEVIHIQHSYMDNEFGESDITVIMNVEHKKIGLLIENKIDAQAMSQQYFRYVQRGKKGIAEGKYDDFAVFIIAPQSYLESNHEAKKYENQISYEKLLQFFSQFNQEYDAKLMNAAIQKQAKGYIVQEVPSITDFWKKIYNYCSCCNRKIEMYSVNGPKGLRSTWLQFKIPLKGAALYYKANQGVCDLQFNGKRNDSLRLKTDFVQFLDEDMHWTDTGESLSLRIKVKKIDVKRPFEESQESIELVLEAIERLTALAVKLNDVGYVL